jgi:glycosyltransferase involved in cell wall biosynthesis
LTKKILIISYSFPPSNKIGGRRWVKFSKYLTKNGFDVQVITSKNKNENAWLDDLTYLKNKIDSISFNYPSYLGIVSKNYFQKIMYRLSLLWSKLNTEFNYFDKSVHGKKNLLRKVRFYLRNGFDNVIVSVAPFHMATFISELIPQYPEVNFIVDFRDPWLENESSYGYHTISKKRQIKENESERKVINSFNHVVSVSKFITDSLIIKYPNSNAEFHTIPNGFDNDDISELSNDISSNKIKLIFAGTLYDNSKKYFKKLVELLNELKIIDEELYNKIEIDFYGSFSSEVYNIHETIIIKGYVDNKEINNQILSADACLLFLSDDINYSFSTKFCEYIGRKKPIIVFSNNGPTSKYLVKNKIGESLTLNSCVNDFINVVESISKKTKFYYDSFDTKFFELNYLSNNYVQLIK